MLVEVLESDISESYLDGSKCPLERALSRKFDADMFVSYTVYGCRTTQQVWIMPKDARLFALNFDASTILKNVVAPATFEFPDIKIEKILS